MSSSEWRKFRLKDITLKIGSGSTPRGGSQVYTQEGVSFIRSQNVYNNSFDYNGLVFINDEAAYKLKSVTLEENDILLNITGDSVARCTIVPMSVIPGRVNQHVAIIRVNNQLADCRFIKYWLVSPYMQQIMLSLANSGGTRAALTKGMIENFEILLPTLCEQTAIANILSSLDDKIELNNQMNETLEEMAQALFTRWFVNFEFPNEEGQPYNSSGGEMIESELGMIPKGWYLGTLNDICEYRKDKISTAQLNLENYISTENMISNKAGITVATGLPSVDKVNKFEPKNILVSNIRPYFKKIYFADIEGGCSNDVLCFKPDKEEYAIFLFLTLFEDKFFDYMMAGSKGTKMPRGDKNQIMKYIITIAPSNIYSNFNDVILPIFTKISEHKKQNKILREIRDTLLPKLMSGEIRVSDLKE